MENRTPQTTNGLSEDYVEEIGQYHCPRCKTFNVWEIHSNLFCPKCGLTFYKKFLKFLNDDDILANEELEGIIKVFVDEDLERLV